MTHRGATFSLQRETSHVDECFLSYFVGVQSPFLTDVLHLYAGLI